MSVPPLTITYPPELPVSQARDELARLIGDNQVVIVAGETGSGKTTQLPKICLELGRERIGHTQPRRIAARSIAERIADELGVELGGVVGYQVRFDDRAKADTAIKLMTDGVLLAEINRDRDLTKYDTIILDEAHERSLTIDFLLGYLRQLLPRRPDLKVIVTSATIDPESFARHFATADGTPAPIVEVSGRTYPVEVRYRPLVEPVETADDELGDGATGSTDAKDYLQGITDALAELAREPAGDVLVFLSGETEIRDAEDAVRASAGPDTEVVPLYGRLSAADQHRVFDTKRAPGIRRRVVLSTNVAETSLTVPGIKYVIDAGTARISRYSVRSKVQRLPIEAISQASANQRAGRAGRTSDGIAIRLYSHEDYEKRPAFTDPEILRTNLAAVILQMVSIGLGDIAAFPFLQPPDSRGIQDGIDLLTELGALSGSSSAQLAPLSGSSSAQHSPLSGSSSAQRVSRPPAPPLQITKIGRELAQLPVDPRFGRMLVEAKRHDVLTDVAAIVAGLSIQDVRERPLEKRPQADQAHARFADPTSDFLSLLALWKHLEEKQAELSSSAFRRMCRAEYLNYLRVREWHDLYRQILRAAGSRQRRSAGSRQARSAEGGAARADAIHRSLLAGLLSRIGLRDERTTDKKAADKRTSREYLGARNARFAIFPGSALAKKGPPAVMAAALVETSRLFARTVAAIDPAWAESLAGDLVKRSYGEPRWEKRQGSAVADEKVTLYGVPIVPKRRIQLARIDAEQARELFIRHALVDGDWPYATRGNTLFDFDRANRRLRRELEEVEERTRRRDILIDDEAIVAFYDRVLPRDVTDVRRFETWWKRVRADEPDLLTLTTADLVDEEPEAETLDAGFPTEWTQGEQRLRLAYRFVPGADDDGVTVEVPLALLPRLEPTGFDWLVPGLRDELVTALLRSLPKAIRKNVVPAADWARRLMSGSSSPHSGPSSGSSSPHSGRIETASSGSSSPHSGRIETPPAATPLLDFLAAEIRAQTHTPVSPADFDLDRVAPHLRMTFAAVDERGRRIALSKDLAALQAKLRETSRASVAKATTASGPDRALERAGITSWDVDELPRMVESRAAGGSVRGFPAFVDEGAAVAIRVFATSAEQAREHPRGVRRLLALALPSPLGYVQEHLTGPEKLLLASSPYRSTAAMLDDALLAVLDAQLGDEPPFTRSAFEALRARASAGLMESLFELVSTAAKVMDGARKADKSISAASSISLMGPLADARAQLAALVHPGFVRATGAAQLRRVPVYLAGLTYRVERLADNVGRDRQWQTEVEQATALYRDAGGTLPLEPDAEPRLASARWMLEELRLSLFAQPLGAAGPVSVPRIRKALEG